MDNLIEKIKEYVMEECRKYKEASEEHYWVICRKVNQVSIKWTDGKPGWEETK